MVSVTRPELQPCPRAAETNARRYTIQNEQCISPYLIESDVENRQRSTGSEGNAVEGGVRGNEELAPIKAPYSTDSVLPGFYRPTAQCCKYSFTRIGFKPRLEPKSAWNEEMGCSWRGHKGQPFREVRKNLNSETWPCSPRNRDRL